MHCIGTANKWWNGWLDNDDDDDDVDDDGDADGNCKLVSKQAENGHLFVLL